MSFSSLFAAWLLSSNVQNSKMGFLHFYFHPRVGRKAGKNFDPLFVSLHLFVFSDRTCFLGKQSNCKPSKHFPSCVCSNIHGQARCVSPSCLPIPSCRVRLWEAEISLPSRTSASADSWHALTHALIERKMKEEVMTFICVFPKLFPAGDAC